MRSSRYAASRAAALLACAALAAPAAAQVQVSLRPLAPPEAFFVADLMPGSTGARPDLVGITLVSDGRPKTLSLEVTVARETPSPTQIFRGTTNPFVLNAAVRQLTLRDLASSGRDVSITKFDVADGALDGPGGRSGTTRTGSGGSPPAGPPSFRRRNARRSWVPGSRP